MLRLVAPLAVLVACVGPAIAVELPMHKPGLWEMTMTLGGKNRPGITIKRCTDAETDTLLTALAQGWAKDTCTQQDVKRDGDKLTIDSICTVGSAKTITHAEITGSFDDAYTMKVATRREGKPGSEEEAERTVVMNAKWTGPCAADQKPGDIILPGGITMNVRNFGGLLGLAAPK